MKLFTHRSTQYVDPGTELPIAYLQGQLDKEQAEYDLQQAAIAKGTENFLKITPGLITQDKYKEVKDKYLPQWQNLQEEFRKYGNIDQTSTNLYKLTSELATDPNVQDVMADAALLPTYQQGLLKGDFNKDTLPLIHDKEGNTIQLRPNERWSADLYSPFKFRDPIPYFGKSVDDFLKSDGTNYTVGTILPDGTKITSQVQAEELKAQKIKNFLQPQYRAFVEDPENKGFINQITGRNPKAFTEEMYNEHVVKPLLQMQYNKSTTKVDMDKPSPNVNTRTGNTTNPKTKDETLFSFAATGTAPFQMTMTQTGKPVESLADLQKDIEYNYNLLQPTGEAVAKLVGVNPRDIDPTKFDETINQLIDANFTTDDQGYYIYKDGRRLDEADRELINAYQNTSIKLESLENLEESIVESTGVRNYNSQLINKAVSQILNEPSLNKQWLDVIQANKYNPSFNPEKAREDFIKQNQNYIDSQISKYLPKDSNEYKVYKAFENFKNHRAEIEVTNMPENENYDAIENTIIGLATTGGLKLRKFVDNSEIDTKDFDTEFTKKIPISTKQDGSQSYDNKKIGLKFGFDPSNGVIGIISLNGEMFEFDISEGGKTNFDQFITDENSTLKAKLRAYDQIHKSFKSTSNTKGKFTLDNEEYNFERKFRNIGSDKPEFYYEFDFDDKGKRESTDLGTIVDAAANKYYTNSLLIQGQLQTLQNELVNKLTKDPGRSQEHIAEFNKKREALNEQTRQPRKYGLGKKQQWVQTPKTPLQ